jgi:receptor expression-enhancing protein 5/6
MAAKQQLDRWRSEVTKKLHEPSQINDVLGKVEAKSGVDRFFIVAGVAGVFALYMIFGYFAALVCNIIGLVYPGYMSVKAIETQSRSDDTQWLTYWVIVAILGTLEFAQDTIYTYFPLYWLIKCIFLVYLYGFRGAETVYEKVIHPIAQKYMRTPGFVGSTIDDVKDAANGVAQDIQDGFHQD